MREFRAHFTIRGGRMEWKNPAYVGHQLTNFEGCEGVAIAKKKWNKRSVNQNALLWMWYEVIGDYCGMSPEETHTVFKGLYAPRSNVKVGKKSYSIPRSTTTFTKGEMVEYMFHVEKEANQMGIILPHPEDLNVSQLLDNTE